MKGVHLCMRQWQCMRTKAGRGKARGKVIVRTLSECNGQPLHCALTAPLHFTPSRARHKIGPKMMAISHPGCENGDWILIRVVSSLTS